MPICQQRWHDRKRLCDYGGHHGSQNGEAKNSITNLGIVLGQNLLPIVGDVADKVAVLVTKISEFAQANPKLVQTVLKVAGAWRP